MRQRGSQAGQSAVEFALVLPILLLLLMGMFDFGRAFYYYNAVANAAREICLSQLSLRHLERPQTAPYKAVIGEQSMQFCSG